VVQINVFVNTSFKAVKIQSIPCRCRFCNISRRFSQAEHVGRGYLNTVCFALFNITPAVANGKSSHRFFLLVGIRCTVIVALCALPVNRPFPSSSSVSLPKRV